MDKLKKQLQTEIESCQERSKYEKELFLTKAESLFHIEKLQFESRSNPVVQGRKGMKRKRSGTQDDVKLLGVTDLPQSTKQEENHHEYVHEYRSHKRQDCKYQKLEEAQKEGGSTTDSLNHYERSLENHDSLIRSGTVAKKLLTLKNVPVLSISNTVDNIDNSKDISIRKNEKQTVLRGGTKPILSCNEKENERSIEFAMLFCSRSIKNSSKANSFKRLENLTRNDMRKAMSLAKNSVGFNPTRQMKRKREDTLSSAVTKSETLSTANSIGLRCGKRYKYDSANNTYQSKINLR